MGRLSEAFGDARKRAGGMIDLARKAGPGTAFARGGGGIEAIGRSAQTLSQHAEQLRHFQGYVYAIIRTIANRIAGQPLRVAKKKPRKPEAGPKRWQAWKSAIPARFKDKLANGRLVENHPLHDVFDKPNPIMVRYTLMFVTIACLELTGKAFWWLRRLPNGTCEIWPLPASWVEPVHDEDKLYSAWRVTPPGVTEAFTVKGPEIAYFYYPDPSNPMGAVAPLQALARTVTADEAIEEAQRRGFINGINPGLALIVGRLPEVAGVQGDHRPVLTKEQRNTLINAVKAQYRGVMNMEEPLILDGLIQDAKKITSSNREMDFLQSMIATRSRLSQGWGVNPVSMGEMNSNRAESAVADDHLNVNVINPRLEMIGEIMTQRVAPYLCPDEPDLVLYLEASRAIDPDHELSVDMAMVDRGTMSRNEWRARRNLPPIVGGDSAYVGGQLVEVVVERPGAMKTPWPDDDASPGNEEEVDNATDIDPAALPQQPADLAPPLGEKGHDVYRAALLHKRSEIVERAGESALLAASTKASGELRQSIHDGAGTEPMVADRAFDEHDWTETVNEIVLPVIKESALAAMSLEWALYGPDDRKDSPPVQAAEEAVRGCLAILEGNRWREVRKAAAEGVAGRMGEMHAAGMRGDDLSKAATDALALAEAKKSIAKAAEWATREAVKAGREAATRRLDEEVW